MTSRRQFLVSAPLGAAGVLAAHRAGSAPQQPGLAPPRPLLATVPSDAATLTWTPKHTDLVYTFGGATPRQRIKPRTRIVTWTEDCFDGAVKTAADLPSKVMAPGHDNPQTGPFYIEGAEPGDTVAVHLRKLEPARNYAVSSFGPGFGAMVGTTQTAMLGPDFPERRGATTSIVRATSRTRRAPTASTRGRFRSRPSSAASASHRRMARAARPSSPATSAATWTAGKCAQATPSSSA